MLIDHTIKSYSNYYTPGVTEAGFALDGAQTAGDTVNGYHFRVTTAHTPNNLLKEFDGKVKWYLFDKAPTNTSDKVVGDGVKFNTYRITTESTSGSDPKVKIEVTDYLGAESEHTVNLTTSYSDDYATLSWYQPSLSFVLGARIDFLNNNTQSMGNFENAVGFGQTTVWSYSKEVDYTIKVPVNY